MTMDHQGENERKQQDDDGPVLVPSQRDISSFTTYARSSLHNILEITDFCALTLVRLWKSYCSYGILLITMVAAVCTFVASWDCHTFYSSEVSSEGVGGGGYGIWSLEDSGQQCQLWDVLFASHHLDTPLRIARFFSMAAMLASLEAIAILGQVVPRGRMASSLVTLAGLVFWLVNTILASGSRFNVWSSFFILTYLWMVLFTKNVLFPKCSLDTLWKLTEVLMLVCCVGSGGIFAILASNFCLCDTSSSPRSLDAFNASLSHLGLESSSGQCVLGRSSPIAIVSPILWLFGWIEARLISLETRNDDTVKTSTNGLKLRPKSGKTSTGGLSDHDPEDETHNDDVESGTETCFQNSESELSCESLPIPLPSIRLELLVEQDINEENSDRSSRSNKLQPETWRSEIKSFGDRATKSVGDLDLIGKASDELMDTLTSAKFQNRDASSSTDTNRVSESSSTLWKQRLEYICWIIITMLEMFIVAVLLGAYFENERAALAPDTSYNFITEVVCAFDESGVFETFDNPNQAHLAGYKVAHCGPCGECSNPSDIARYVETRTTVARQAKNCSLEAILGSDEDLESCLEREIGFTPSCTTCWAENMRNTAKQCLWTCLSNILTGIASNNTVAGAKDYDWLNQCVFCDEKRSGPTFVECSGVARRRLGIPSEFQRDPTELCPLVDVDYLSPSWMKDFITI